MNTNCRSKRTKKITKYVFNERMRRAEKRKEQKSYIRAYAKYKELFFAIEMNVNTTNRTMKAVFMLATVHPFHSHPTPTPPSAALKQSMIFHAPADQHPAFRFV